MNNGSGNPFPRGVYIAPWKGSNGETVLFSRDRHGKLFEGPTEVPLGSNHVLFSDRMWERLDDDDPMPTLRIV